ncbi:hypothetical protein P7C70_g3652, partial [Phenoliferia sp. Uapishka_3]
MSQAKKALMHRTKAYNAFTASLGFPLSSLVLEGSSNSDGTTSCFLWVLNLNSGGGMIGLQPTAEQVLDRIAGVVEVIEWLGKPYTLVEFESGLQALAAMESLRNRTALYVELAHPDVVPSLLASFDATILPTIRTDDRYGLHKRWDNGLILLEDFVTEKEEREIMEGILGEDEWHGDLSKRQSRHAGPVFDYTTFTSSISESRPIPSYLAPILPRLPRLPKEPISDQLTVQYYPPGTGIPPHVDTHSAFGESLYSLSLHSAVNMTLVECGPEQARRLRLPKRSLTTDPSPMTPPPSRPPSSASTSASSPPPPTPPSKSLTISLPPRSLLIMTGASRYGWTHAIPPRRADQVGRKVVQREAKGRYSVTFRSVRRGVEYSEESHSVSPCLAFASLPSNSLPTPDTSYTVPSRAHKPPTKTYGRRVVPEADASSSTAQPSRSSSAAFVVPETDPVQASDLMTGDLDSDVEQEGSLERESDQEAAHASSTRRERSPSIGSLASSERTDLTTDPTSAEEEGDRMEKSRRQSSSYEREASSSSSDDNDDDAMDLEDPNAPSIFNRKSVAEMMAELDAQADAEDDAAGPPLMHLGLLPPPSDKPAMISSPLTSLVDSSVILGGGSSSRLPSSQPLATTSKRPAPVDSADSDEESVKPTFTRKHKRQVVASESDEDENSSKIITKVTRRPSPPRHTGPAVVQSSDDDSEAEASPEPTRPLTKREKMEAMAAKKRPPPPPVKEIEVTGSQSASGDSSDEDTRKAVKGKKRKTSTTKGLTKKAEDATHREAAALQRAQHARLQPRTKQQLSVANILNRTANSFISAPIHVHRPPSNMVPLSNATKFSLGPRATSVAPAARQSHEVIPSSSSAIEEAETSSPKPLPLSEKARGKQRVETRRTVKLERPLGNKEKSVKVDSDSDDEDFLGIDELLKLDAEKKKKEAFMAKKAAAAAKASSSTIADEDSSDSDIEILDDPSRRPLSTPRLALVEETKNPRLSRTARKLDELTDHHAHHEEDASESQIVNAARSFGKDLSAPSNAALPRPTQTQKRDEDKAAPAAKKSRANVPVRVDRDSLNHSLLHRSKIQNIASTTKKRVNHRAEVDKRAREEVAAKVDVAGLLGKKAEKVKDEGEALDEEDADDPDFMAGEDIGESEDEAVGSGSDEERASGSDAEDDERGDLESGVEEEKVGGEEAEEKLSVLQTPMPAPKVQVQVQAMEMNDEADFSDFFGTAFDAEIGQGPQEAGFAGFQQASQEPAVFFNPIIDSREQEKDGEVLMQEVGILDTPAVVKPQFQQYINKHGMYTQTVQDTANLFEDSPSDTPRHASSTFGRSHSMADTESQTLTPTQLDAQTPTQAPRNGNSLHRAHGLMPYSAYNGSATQIEPNATLAEESQADAEVQDDDETQDDTELNDFPTAAQPVRNAFEVLAMGAKAKAVVATPTPVVEKKRQARNEFVLAEADRDDEEDNMMGMGNDSADEDETGMDEELESLVDNEEKDRDVVDEENARVEELRAELEAKEEAEKEARMKAITEGKERLKRKNGGLDFDDDDFDDDGYGMAKRTDKRARVENKTMADLEANEETQSFAAPLKDGLSVPINDLAFLVVEEQSGDEDGEEEDRESNGYSTGEDRNGSDADQFSSKPYRSMKQRKEEERRIIEQAKQKNSRERSPSPRLYTGQSSSPAPKIKIKVKTASAASFADLGEPDIDSHYKLQRSFSSSEAWKADSKEDSQVNANGIRSGKTSAVTSFKTENARAKATYGGTLEAGNHGKAKVVPRQSRMGTFKKNGFAN